jgi:hypothetical protein
MSKRKLESSEHQSAPLYLTFPQIYLIILIVVHFSDDGKYPMYLSVCCHSLVADFTYKLATNISADGSLSDVNEMYSIKITQDDSPVQ